MILSSTISAEDFDSLNVSFNINKPIDVKNNMENIKLQYEMGTISKRTIMEQSPYTTDSTQELQRLAKEDADITKDAGKITDAEQIKGDNKKWECKTFPSPKLLLEKNKTDSL